MKDVNQRFKLLFLESIDQLQCLPLAEDTVGSAFRATYLPTFHRAAIIELRLHADRPAELTFITASDADPRVLLDRTVVVPDAALARWHAALDGLDLPALSDAPMQQGRDGMVTVGEAVQGDRQATFIAWHPEAGSPWERFFTAMLAVCRESSDNPLLQRRLAELTGYR